MRFAHLCIILYNWRVSPALANDSSARGLRRARVVQCCIEMRGAHFYTTLYNRRAPQVLAGGEACENSSTHVSIVPLILYPYKHLCGTGDVLFSVGNGCTLLENSKGEGKLSGLSPCFNDRYVRRILL